MSGATASSRPDLYSRVTQSIISALEQGVRPWSQPWSADHLAGQVTRPLRHTGEPYKGVNILLLWSEAILRGFSAPHWMTFRQALELGGAVRRGEHGATVVYANHLTRSDTGPDGVDVEHSIAFLKAYTVFNVEQIDGLPERYRVPAPEPLAPNLRIEAAERFFAATRADIRHGGGRAYYAGEADYVQMPPFECFLEPEGYYATLAHECTHWTKHANRLDRDFGRKRWGDDGYAREELVALSGQSAPLH